MRAELEQITQQLYALRTAHFHMRMNAGDIPPPTAPPGAPPVPISEPMQPVPVSMPSEILDAEVVNEQMRVVKGRVGIASGILCTFIFAIHLFTALRRGQNPHAQ